MTTSTKSTKTTTALSVYDILFKAWVRFNDGTGRAVQVRDDGSVSCKYRAPDGNKCVVGCMLPDKYYKDSMEGRGILGLLGYGYKLPRWVRTHQHLLKALQNIHDTESNWQKTEDTGHWYLNDQGRALFNQLSALVLKDERTLLM